MEKERRKNHAFDDRTCQFYIIENEKERREQKRSKSRQRKGKG